MRQEAEMHDRLETLREQAAEAERKLMDAQKAEVEARVLCAQQADNILALQARHREEASYNELLRTSAEAEIRTFTSEAGSEAAKQVLEAQSAKAYAFVRAAAEENAALRALLRLRGRLLRPRPRLANVRKRLPVNLFAWPRFRWSRILLNVSQMLIPRLRRPWKNRSRYLTSSQKLTLRRP